MRIIIIAALITIFMTPTAYAAGEYEGAIRKQVSSQIKGWTTNPAIVAAINAQNGKHAGLSQADIDALDKKWRAETKSNAKPMINEMLGRDASKELAGYKNESKGLFTEIFVMDNKGLNVAQSDVTSDYWQGDEGKWSNSFNGGSGRIFIGPLKLDESTNTVAAQVSAPVLDRGKTIGVLVVGVTVNYLQTRRQE